MLYVAITFDYELFFGKNFVEPKEVLFQPTEEIFSILEKEQVSATFFADVCSVFRHKDYGLFQYTNEFEKQIQQLHSSGQDIQLHIHPHWYKSEYRDGEWDFNKKYYRIHHYGLEENSEGEKIILNSADYLNELVQKVDPQYKCIAYRAGGYCIQPHASVVRALQKKGILIDSSVSLMMENREDLDTYYAFTDLPDALNWYLSPSRELTDAQSEAENGNLMYEVPIGFYRRNMVDRIRTIKTGFGIKKDKPKGYAIEILRANVSSTTLKKILSYNQTIFQLSLDSLSAEILMIALNRLYNQYKLKNEDGFIAILGHPKTFSGDSFANLQRFITFVKQNGNRYQFVNFHEIGERIRYVDK